MDKANIEAAANALCEGRLHGRRMDELDGALRPLDEAQAYTLQRELHRVLGEKGHGEVVGYKIGCTTEVMQRFLGIPNPCAGGVFDHTVLTGDATVDWSAYAHPGVECELAVRLRAPLDEIPATDQALLAAIECAMPAIEIVDDRWRDYGKISTPTLIADDFFGAGCVLGPAFESLDAIDLAALGGGMTINGESLGSGRGADILGHPLNALRWLAALQGERGQPLQAGQIVLLGSLVQTVWVKEGDRVAVSIDRLGSASLHFA